jgi:hypothetical protein
VTPTDKDQLRGGTFVQNTEKESNRIKARGGRRPGAGRPVGVANKMTRPVKALAASYGPASIARLVQLRDGAESEQVRFAASKELLDRAYGRPRQELDVTQNEGIRVLVYAPQPGDEPPALADHSRAEE